MRAFINRYYNSPAPPPAALKKRQDDDDALDLGAPDLHARSSLVLVIAAVLAMAGGLVVLRGGLPLRDPKWMETRNAFHGAFHKLTHFPNVALAVSKTNQMDLQKVYDAPS